MNGQATHDNELPPEHFHAQCPDCGFECSVQQATELEGQCPECHATLEAV